MLIMFMIHLRLLNCCSNRKPDTMLGQDTGTSKEAVLGIVTKTKLGSEVLSRNL